MKPGPGNDPSAMQQRIQGLFQIHSHALSPGRNLAIHDPAGKKPFDTSSIEIPWVLFLAKDYEILSPVRVIPDSTLAVIPNHHVIMKALQEGGWCHFDGFMLEEYSVTPE